jgi:hypothetical protein
MNNQPDQLMREIYQAIYAALESRVYLIGSMIDADARREIIAQNIYDKGDFYDNAGYLVENQPGALVLRVGSNVRHEPFVLGGKVPSWTPIAPLKAWVERKGLAWTDKKSGKLLTIEQMAYMIRGKIKREGIPARNVYETVIKNREAWIYQQLDSIEVKL